MSLSILSVKGGKKGEDRKEAPNLFRKSRLSHRRFGEQSKRTHNQMLDCTVANIR